MLQEGTLIAGRYEIHSALASGGNGLVFAAKDLTTEKRVAVKVLGPHMLHERAAREKLRLEAIVAGRVESEHIVQVSDAGVDVSTGTPFLVMELLRGLDLQHHIEEFGPLEYSVAIEYLRQVASGLDKAHGWRDRDGRSAPIVHRDLKPENLFLTHREDGSPLVKILDFGLAKVLSASATLSSEIKGTPLYMAPEQLSQLPVTPATDIWALGLIAFFFLSGKCYWLSAQNDRAVLPAVIKEVTEGVAQPATARARQLSATVTLPDAFNDWFAQCVNLDPTRRFAQASTAVKSLAAVLDYPLLSSPLGSAGALPLPAARTSVTDLSTAALNADRPSAAAMVTARNDRPSRAAVSKYVFAALALGLAIVLVFSLRRGKPSDTRVTAATASEPSSAPPGNDREHPARILEPVPTPTPEPGTAAPQLTAAAIASVPDRPKENAHRPTATAPGANPSQPATNGVSSGRPRPSREGAPLPALSTGDRALPASPASSHVATQTPAPAATRVARDPADHR